MPRMALRSFTVLGLLAILPLAAQAGEVRTKPLWGIPKATVRAVDDDEYVNPSALLFERAPRRQVELYEEGDPAIAALPPVAAKLPGRTTPPTVTLKRGMTRRVHWNSEAGRSAGDALISPGAAQATLMSLDLDGPDVMTARGAQSNAQIACVEPDIVKSGSDCCNYGITDQVASKSYYYRQPAWAFASGDNAASEQTCRDFAEDVTASMPLFVPYKNSHVRAGQGWFYNSGSFHGAVDYSKDEYTEGKDPSFRIYSIGAGTVRSVVWDNWSGNIVVIEHVAPNGKKYRSAYKHMRNGFTNDLAKAKAIPLAADKKFDAEGKPTQTYKYKLFANLANPSKLLWGTDTQKIAVKPGDKVHAGQFIGWSGNTGPGGAGKGLNDDGTPKNTITGNNHLHFMLAVPNPSAGETEWVQVDPYGVYGMVSSECYDVLDDTPYARLFAPFYPAFHNVPTSILAKRFGYYPGMGYGLQTLSLHRKGNKVLASGSFERGLSGQWKCRFYMTGEQYQHWFEEYGKQGLRPHKLSVTNDSQGNARFTAIWKKDGPESFVAHHGMTDAVWKQKWDELVVKGKMRVEECVTYTDRGAPRLAAIFVKDGEHAFYEKHYMDGNAFQSSFNTYSGQGFTLTNVNAASINGKTLFTGIWRKRPGSWVAKHGMSPADYQKLFDQFSSSGYRLYHVHAYNDSERFAAVWMKP